MAARNMAREERFLRKTEHIFIYKLVFLTPTFATVEPRRSEVPEAIKNVCYRQTFTISAVILHDEC